MNKITEGNITLTYQLVELPSPQHRAGLAGLVLMVRELKQQAWFEKRDNAVIEFTTINEYGLILTLNLEGLKALFDLTYQSFNEYRWTTTKDKDKKYGDDEIREQEKKDKRGKVKTVTEYRYSVVIPTGAFLPYWDKSNEGGNQGLWIKLWRDMFWRIIKGVPATRNPFNFRCNLDYSHLENFYSKDAEILWKELKNPEKSTGQSGAFYLGAMAVNAENVPTDDLIKYQFLLHFWAFMSQVYCPATLDKDGKRELNGYVIVVPDVANLIDFCDEFQYVLEARKLEIYGYRPREAIIDIPEEGALDLLRLLRQSISQKTASQSLEDLILGAEVIHVEKPGNSVKIQSISYIEPNLSQIDRYAEIQDAYWCPWFRKQRLINLLNSPFYYDNQTFQEIPAWTGFDALLSRIPGTWLKDSYFSHDARQLFTQEGDFTMTKEIREYAQIVYQVCQHYVLSKLKSKYDLSWDKCKNNKRLEDEYNDKKGRIANEAFLAVRSRTENQAFIDYFVSTLYPFVKKDEFADFAAKLFNETDEIRALTLLALSSQFPSSKKSDLDKAEAA